MRTTAPAGRPAPLSPRSRTLLGVGAGAGLVLAVLGASPAGAATEPEGTACEEGEGVTVVVDATDLDGPLTVACVTEEGLSGAEALAAAGHTSERDEFMMVCSIDDRPDPCPTEWEGFYWAYWTTTPDGGWTLHEEGSDTTFPEPGAVEGWRWSDGTEGPDVDLAALGTGTPADGAEGGPESGEGDGTEGETDPAEPADPADPGTEEGDETAPDDAPGTGEDAAPDGTDQGADGDEGGVSVLVVAALVLAALIGAGALVAATRRRRADDAATASEDDGVPPSGPRTDRD